MAMPLAAAHDHLARGHVKGCTKRRRAEADRVARVVFGIAQVRRQDRLGAVQRLNLGLLVGTEHDRVAGRMEVECRDIENFFQEERIVG